MAKQKSLPGMEDRENKTLKNLADKISDVRDQRLLLKKKEADVKGKIVVEMRKLGRVAYQYNGVKIEVVAGEEKVKVSIIKEDDEGKDNAE